MSKIKVTVKRPNWFWSQYLKLQALVCGVRRIIGFTTFWNTVLIINEHYKRDDELLAHELTHVKQIDKHGIFKFTWLYCVEFFKHGYRQNSFEVEARDNAKRRPKETIAEFDITYK